MGKWFEDITGADQLKRLATSKKAECTPLSIDKEKETGAFSGKHGSYEASMEHCTCQDYSRRRLPCKHMMRLAIELGYIKEAVESDIQQVHILVDSLSLAETVQRLESLSVEAQHIYHNFLYQYIYKKTENIRMENSDELCQIVNAGLAQIVKNDQSLLESMTGIEIMEHLKMAECAPQKRPRTNAALVAWCLENVENISDIFFEYSMAAAPANTKKAMRKTYTYLRRKFDSEPGMDENGNMVEYPAGASLTTSVGMDGVVSGRWAFPKDEVTDLLDQYHCNRCNDILPI